MSDTTLESAGLSRRSLMKVGLIGGAFLATAGVTASLTGCSAEKPASGLEKVRESDLPFLRALLPVMLLGAVSAEQMPKAVEGAIQSLDHNLARLSPEMFKLTQQLFDVLALPLTRGPLTGIWGSWENASGDDAGIPFALGKQLHRPVADGPQFADATGDDGLVRPPRGVGPLWLPRTAEDRLSRPGTIRRARSRLA